jgi:hypothetical protein
MSDATARQKRSDISTTDDTRPGISNRESASEEAAEREAHRPIDTQPVPEDAAGRVGDATGGDLGGQTSHKAGSRSIAQKEAGSRYPDRPMPPSRKVDGAFGKEPLDTPTDTRQEPGEGNSGDARPRGDGQRESGK